MATTEEYDQARTAVEAAPGQATKEQKELVAKEAKLAGRRGDKAREALGIR